MYEEEESITTHNIIIMQKYIYDNFLYAKRDDFFFSSFFVLFRYILFIGCSGYFGIEKS